MILFGVWLKINGINGVINHQIDFTCNFIIKFVLNVIIFIIFINSVIFYQNFHSFLNLIITISVYKYKIKCI